MSEARSRAADQRSLGMQLFSYQPSDTATRITIASSLISLTMLVTCLCAWRIHGTADSQGMVTRVPGGRPLIAAAAALAAGLAVYSIAKPLLDANQDGAVISWTTPVETFGLAGWLAAGIAWYALTDKQRRTMSRSTPAAIIIGK